MFGELNFSSYITCNINFNNMKNKKQNTSTLNVLYNIVCYIVGFIVIVCLLGFLVNGKPNKR